MKLQGDSPKDETPGMIALKRETPAGAGEG
jgi:hypothetical protein